jgi:uncharacterized protein YjbI with pentapeptide repeats
MIRLFKPLSFFAAALAFAPAAKAQDMTHNVDLSSPMYTMAEMTRADIEKALASGEKPDLSGKSLNGLDLSGLDLSGVNFRAARVNKTKFAGAKLISAIFDQAWAVGADFSSADLSKASLFAAQMQDTNFDQADLTSARIAGDFSRAHLRKAKFAKADLSADMKNQSMGLMRAVFRSADLEGADFENADLARADLQFAKFKAANFTRADLSGAEAGGADFRGAIFDHTDLSGCDVTSARIDASEIKAFAKADHLDRALKE